MHTPTLRHHLPESFGRKATVHHMVAATATFAVTLALTACGATAVAPVAGPAAAAVVAVALEAPARRTYVAPAPVPVAAPVASAEPTSDPTPEPAAAVPSTAPAVPAASTPTPKVKAASKAATPTASASATSAAAAKPAVPAPAASPQAPVAPSPSRAATYRGVPVIYADPDGYPGAWGTASAQAIWVYPATPARYVDSVKMHEYIHVLEYRAGWTDVASTHGERVADAGEQILGGSYFKYTHGAPTAGELAEAHALLGG